LSYVLAVDLGTSGCKVALVDPEGRALAKAARKYEVVCPDAVSAEQDPLTWWSAFCEATREVLSWGFDPANVAALAISGQAPVVVPVDETGSPLHNALLWMDRRAARQAEKLTHVLGGRPDPSSALAKMLWFEEERPSIFERTAKFLQASDFLAFRLTGRFATDKFTAMTAFFDPVKWAWPDFMEELGILDKLPEVLEPGSAVGNVSAEAAKETGLSEGTLVVAGSIDAYLAVLGSGALDPGSACDVTGTSTCLMVTHSEFVVDPKGRVFCAPHFLDGLTIVSGVMSTTGASLEWFTRLLGRGGLDELTSEASNVPAGADGLIFLPYLAGERSPIWDPLARGALVGLTLGHGRGHVFRALLEGCALGLRHVLEAVEEIGVSVRELRACGGGSRNDLWCQIKADVTGKPILAVEEAEASLMGAAMLASVGGGLHRGLREAASSMVRVARAFYPRSELREAYDRLFELYKRSYQGLKDVFRGLTSVS